MVDEIVRALSDYRVATFDLSAAALVSLREWRHESHYHGPNSTAG